MHTALYRARRGGLGWANSGLRLVLFDKILEQKFWHRSMNRRGGDFCSQLNLDDLERSLSKRWSGSCCPDLYSSDKEVLIQRYS